MANLRVDLLNDLRSDKYYAETELVRLAGIPNMNYKEKIVLIKEVLGEIALINSKIGLAEGYFPSEEQQPVQQPTEQMTSDPQPQQQSQPLPGQSHAE